MRNNFIKIILHSLFVSFIVEVLPELWTLKQYCNVYKLQNLTDHVAKKNCMIALIVWINSKIRWVNRNELWQIVIRTHISMNTCSCQELTLFQILNPLHWLAVFQNSSATLDLTIPEGQHTISLEDSMSYVTVTYVTSTLLGIAKMPDTSVDL